MTDLDELIRATMHDYARDIDDLPPHLAALASPGAATTRRPRNAFGPLLAVAAAVVAVLVVSSVWLLRRTGSDGEQVVTRPSCEATIPAQWRTAVLDSSLPGVLAPTPVAPAPGGGVLVLGTSATQASAGTTTSLYLVRAGAAAADELAQGDGLNVDSDGTTVVVTDRLGGGRQEIVRLDVRTGQRTVLTRTEVEGHAYVQGGAVYWLTTGSPRQVRSEDLASGRVTTLASAPKLSLLRSAAGVLWGSGATLALHVPARLPDLIAHHVDATTAQTFVTDGESYAWVGQGALEWWSGHGSSVVRVFVGRGRVPLSVAGPLVAMSDGTVVDLRTGARAGLPQTASILGVDGVAFGVQMFGSGSADALQQADTARLDPLTCR